MNQHTSQTQLRVYLQENPQSLPQISVWILHHNVFCCFHIQRKAFWGAISTAIQPWDLLFFFGPHPQKDHNHAFELWLQDTQSKGVQGCSARELPLKDAGKTIPL